jgi:hypothetical protein
MPRTRAFYSVVQYLPDPGRAEAANAGVVLFVPSEKRIDVRTSQTLHRVRQFFAPGKQQLRRIELALEALKNRLTLAREEFKDDAEFARFVNARADAVRLTTPRLVVIDEPLSELNALYEELVGDPPPHASTASAHLPRRLAEVLGRLEVEGKVWRPGSITVPTSRRKFDISFAYQNGVTNFVRAEPLGKGVKLESRLEKLGFNGQLISQHLIDDKPGKLVVLSSDPGVKAETEQEFQRALREFHVRFVPYNQTDEFAAEVEKTAH